MRDSIRFTLCLLAAVLGPACGGGSGGSAGGTAPVISNFEILPHAVLQNSGGGIATVSGSFDYVDPDGDIKSLSMIVTDLLGNPVSSTTVHIAHIGGSKSGSVGGQFFFSTATAGKFILHIQVNDRAKLTSNELTTPFNITTQPPWMTRTAMPTPRTNVAVAASGGLVYVIGGTLPGTGTPGTSTDLVEVYDPAGDSWTTGIPMPSANAGLLTTTVNGKIYALGSGVNLVFDPGAGAWSPLTSAVLPGDAAIASVDGFIYVIGGTSGGFQTGSVETYDTVTDAWGTGIPIPAGRQGLRATSFGGKIYALGGYETTHPPSGYFNDADLFDPVAGSWASLPPMVSIRTRFGCTEAGGLIFAIGGESYVPAYESVEAFDPAKGLWKGKTQLPLPLTRIGAVTVNDKIYVIDSTTTLEYTPDNDPL